MVKKKKGGNNLPIPRGLLVVVSLLVLVFLVVIFAIGDKGFMNLIRLQQKAQDLEIEISQLEKDNQRLQQKIKSLRQNPRYIEKIARKELGLAYPGERVYTYDTTNVKQ